LAVKYEKDTPPTKEQITEIEAQANLAIGADWPLKEFKLPRAEAEEKFAAGVNETPIYDAYPVPPQITELSIVLVSQSSVVGRH